MKCKCGDWECPYVEETNGQCCIPEGCPEWQSYNEMCEGYSELAMKEYMNWIDVHNKIGEVCMEAVKDMKNPPKGKIYYLDFEKSQE